MSTDLTSTLIIISISIGLSLVFSAILTGVPCISSSKAESRNIISLLRSIDLPANAVIYDLGSGWGSLLVDVARAIPTADVRGIEVSPIPYLVSRLRTRKLPNVSLQFGNFFRSELSDANAVFCYLMPNAMPRVSDKLDSALAPGTYVLSNSFFFRNRQIALAQNSCLRGVIALYVWPATIPDKDNKISPEPAASTVKKHDHVVS
jgi:hypothetical protein